MKINVSKITGTDLMRRACSMTIDAESKATLADMYNCEHSPMRTQLFWVEMLEIPTFVSVHFVRHSQGVDHFVKSNREDRGGVKADRDTPVNHGMLINAQALVNMARKRLCHKTHVKTRCVMAMIREEMKEIDHSLFKKLVPECVYRGGVCHEAKPCGTRRLNEPIQDRVCSTHL